MAQPWNREHGDGRPPERAEPDHTTSNVTDLRIVRLEREAAELRSANEILQAIASHFADVATRSSTEDLSYGLGCEHCRPFPFPRPEL
ncbi:hypothetical protein [Amycolatopsis sp. CA-230715]|uniref:hypothetical protein n=1 Tax=Amycolatopsis sp. CA-230715 TaxID=2745196 RepID=UPI001C01160E|nr:hypothetical protein [Amycolatopsis sp. CA-230715]QWF85955.1 hypothetical protein HUW46_09436 [Amycolatopsis sp. CA-230715]